MNQNGGKFPLLSQFTWTEEKVPYVDLTFLEYFFSLSRQSSKFSVFQGVLAQLQTLFSWLIPINPLKISTIFSTLTRITIFIVAPSMTIVVHPLKSQESSQAIIAPSAIFLLANVFRLEGESSHASPCSVVASPLKAPTMSFANNQVGIQGLDMSPSPKGLDRQG